MKISSNLLGRTGQNFDDYPVFQSKKIPVQRYATQCTSFTREQNMACIHLKPRAFFTTLRKSKIVAKLRHFTLLEVLHSNINNKNRQKFLQRMVNQGVNLGFAFAHFVSCVAHIISYKFIVNTFDTSKCLYHIIRFDSASGAICSLSNFVMNILSWYFGIVGSISWCSLWILTGPLRILLGPVFSITSAVIR